MNPSHQLFFATIQLDATAVVTALSLVFNFWQAIKNKAYKQALPPLVQAIELAAEHESNPKNAVRLKTAGTTAGLLIDAVVQSQTSPQFEKSRSME